VSIRAGAALVTVAVLTAACTSGDDSSAEAEPTPEPTVTETPEVDLGGDEALADFYGQTLSWVECDQFECATVVVPLDYEEPDGATIELAVLRVPASGNEDDRLGSLLVNPGGPGASGMEYASQAEFRISRDVRNRFDVVGFDPRGVGGSEAVDCLSDEELDDFLTSEVVPADGEDTEDFVEHAGVLAAGCETRSGDLLAHVGTPDVARDMDVLRAVLGDERLHYLGKSYGTYIGAWYAELFPDRVGRLVLDGAIDPALSGRDMALGQAAGFELALSEFLGYCVEQDNCSLGNTEVEAYGTVRDLVRLIGGSPLPTEDEERPLTQSLAIYGIVLPLYLAPEEGYDALIDAFDSALGGDGSDLLTFADLYLRRNPDDGTYIGNQNEAIYAVNCLDRPQSVTIDDVAESLPEFEEASAIFGEFLAWGALACVDWPASAPIEPGPLTAAGADPILVVGTTGDPATPYDWAESLAAQLESGELLTFDGFGHTAYFTGNSCVDDIVDTYLLEGELPQDATMDEDGDEENGEEGPMVCS
jgi:pimeloyl-ACP methyl ester carboxylesterase